jgi:hypothetical protein
VATSLAALVAVARTSDRTRRSWMPDRPAITVHNRGMPGRDLLLVRATATGRAAPTVNDGDIRAGLRAGYTVIADLAAPDPLGEPPAVIQTAARAGTGAVVAVCNLPEGLDPDRLGPLLADATRAGIGHLVCFAAATAGGVDLPGLQATVERYPVKLAVFRALPAAHARNGSHAGDRLAWRGPGLLCVDVVGEGDDCGAARPVLLRGALEYFARTTRP